MRSDEEMKKFAKRVCEDMGVAIVDEGGFEGMVKFYSGTDNFQSYDRLQSEIKSAADHPKTWARWEKKTQFVQVKSGREDVVKPHSGFSLLAERGAHGWCQDHPCRKTKSSLAQTGHSGLATLRPWTRQ